MRLDFSAAALGLCCYTLATLAAAPEALGIAEEATGRSYPDEITVEHSGTSFRMQATGIALRERTILKVNVYVIVSYADASVELRGDKAKALRQGDFPKRLHMTILRDAPLAKFFQSVHNGIRANYGEDWSAFSKELEAFESFFDRDAVTGDEVAFTYVPDVGMITSLNGRELGIIESPLFAEVMWTVWFGEKPADRKMRERLLERG